MLESRPTSLSPSRLAAALGLVLSACAHTASPGAAASGPAAPAAAGPGVESGSAASEGGPSGGKSFSGNPFNGIPIYRAPYSNAENAEKQTEKQSPADAALLAKIAMQPQASWYGSWSSDISIEAKNYVNAAKRVNALALMVAYNVPNRDCGQYSAGGARDESAYATWIESFAAGIADRRAVIVLEPDAIPLLTQCLSEADQVKRLALIAHAVEVLEALPGVAVYIDAGHSNWVPAGEMASRLKRAGIDKARGFALNTSNFQPDDELIAYGKAVVQALGTDTHFVIDSGRNGNGAAPASNEGWCNPEGRALGRPPSADTGIAELDAFLWVKRPGESDGECKGGPPAGQWFQARAVEMARNARW
jgi:endoglucanase